MLLISRQSKGCEEGAVLYALRLSLKPLMQVLRQGVFPVVVYTGRLLPKGVPFTTFRYMKGQGFH